MMRHNDHDHGDCCYGYPGNHHAGVDVATVIASGVSETKVREQNWHGTAATAFAAVPASIVTVGTEGA